MKHISFLLVFLCLFAEGYSQSSNQNYIRTRTYLYQTGTEYRDEVAYYDGLGRPVQTVLTAFTPAKKDLTTLQEYDAFGRPSINWLPAVMTTATGVYTPPATIKTNARTSNLGDQHPYATTNYEASPLDRPTSQYGPGASWYTAKKAVHTAYLANNAKTGTAIVLADSLVCKLYTTTDTPTSVSITCTQNYGAGELYVTRLTDEEGNKVYEFSNKQGQVILTRQLNETELVDTYYIYDSFGNLRAVLPPLATTALASGTWTETHTTLQQYAYLYQYDNRNRCIAKKLPGADWTYYVYDKADRLIFSQDGEQRKKSEWSFSIPDPLGRVVLTGICKNTFTYTANPLGNTVVKATWAKVTNTNKGYTITGVTLTTPTIFTANYYDSYEFMGLNGVPAATDENFKPETISGYGTQYTGGYQGLLTGSLTGVLDGTIVNNYLHQVMYYDNQSRLIQTKSSNNMDGGVDKEYIGYNFIGQPVKQRIVHSATGKTTQTEEYNYTYDHAGRLTKKTHSLNGTTAVVLEDNTYNELGRLVTTAIAGEDKLKQTYSYNVRGWMAQIQNYHFWEKLAYNMAGNINSINWGQAGKVKTYTFTYDNLSQLKNAAFTGDGAYQVSWSYDKHGNPLTLNRYGYLWNKTEEGLTSTTHGVVNNLTFTYTGNQLKNINDTESNLPQTTTTDFKDYTKGTGIEYTFDANGAMTKDLNKGISDIQYNSLHLAHTIDLKNPVAEARNSYTYTAGGKRLSTIYRWNPTPSTSAVAGSPVTASALTDTKRIDYVANKVYENGTLKRILIEGGYYDVTASKYYFYIQDHLGSNRIVADNTGAIIQSNQYYPFGSTLGESSGALQQPYKYTAKELDMEQGLNFYDYHARQYDPAIGRFTTMDPLAEKYYSVSPYAYCMNNPINAVDLKGDSVWFVLNDNTITMHMTGKVMNVSSNSRVNLSSATERISNRIEKSFQGNVDGYNFKTKVDLSIANSMDEVSTSDHLFVLADMGDYLGRPALGAANMKGGKVAFVDSDYFTGILDRTIGNTGPVAAAHEFGHLLYLDDLDPPNNNNLMFRIPAGYLWGNTKVDKGQLRSIINNRHNLNQGTNSEIYNFISPSSPTGKGYRRMPNRGVSKKFINY